MPANTSRAGIGANITHTIITIASILQLRLQMRLSLLLLLLLLWIVLAVRMRHQILMMHLICIRCGCTIWHRHRCWWGCMWFVLHRFKMIDLSINCWFLEVIVCWWWFIWQLIFSICEFNVIVPCCCYTWWWCWCGYCWCSRCRRTHRRRRLLTTRATCSWYSQFSVMKFIARLIVSLRLWWRLLQLRRFI